MFSAEGEMIELRETLYPVGNVEDWLLELERIMRDTLRKVIKEALGDYKTVSTTLHVLRFIPFFSCIECKVIFLESLDYL